MSEITLISVITFGQKAAAAEKDCTISIFYHVLFTLLSSQSVTKKAFFPLFLLTVVNFGLTSEDRYVQTNKDTQISLIPTRDLPHV